MDFETIVFDTAPTGHTLRFLNFPSILEKGLSRLLSLKEKFSGIMANLGSNVNVIFRRHFSVGDHPPP